MTTFQPQAPEDGDSVLIQLLPPVEGRVVSFEAVVDATDFGRVVGLEILDFRLQLGSAALPLSAVGGLPRWSYDDEMDAFYVRLVEETAGAQRSVVGSAVLDQTGHVTQLRIPS